MFSNIENREREGIKPDQVQKEPNNADARTALAEELLERGNARCVRGWIEAQSGQEAEARQDLQAAVKRDRNDDAWGALSDLAVKGKDNTEAANCYRRVAGSRRVASEAGRSARSGGRLGAGRSGICERRRPGPLTVGKTDAGNR